MKIGAIWNLLSTRVEITNCMIIYIHNSVCTPVGPPAIYCIQFRKETRVYILFFKIFPPFQKKKVSVSLVSEALSVVS